MCLTDSQLADCWPLFCCHWVNGKYSILWKDAPIEGNVKIYMGWIALAICVVINLNKYCYMLHIVKKCLFLSLDQSGAQICTMKLLCESYYLNNGYLSCYDRVIQGPVMSKILLILISQVVLKLELWFLDMW